MAKYRRTKLTAARVRLGIRSIRLWRWIATL